MSRINGNFPDHAYQEGQVFVTFNQRGGLGIFMPTPTPLITPDPHDLSSLLAFGRGIPSGI